MPTDPPIESENSEQPSTAPAALVAEVGGGGALGAVEQDLVDAAIGYAQAARPPNTQRAYERQWRAFERWCEGHGASVLPATPATLALYLTARAREGLTVATLSQAIAAIADKHARAGLGPPHAQPMVQQTWEGIRRTRGSAQRRVAPAVVADLRRMADTLPSSLLGVRDRALLVIGFAGAFRRSELVALNVEDVAVQDDGLIVQVRRSKTDQAAAGTSLGMRRGSDPSTCPVRTLQAWIETSQLTAGALFVAVNRHGQIGARLQPAAVATIVKRSAAAAGLDAARYAGHSLRAGLATSAAKAGKDDRAIMAQGRWGSRTMVDRYVRDAKLLDDDNATAGIGL